MARVTLRPQAELDILELWEFIAADGIRVGPCLREQGVCGVTSVNHNW